MHKEASSSGWARKRRTCKILARMVKTLSSLALAEKTELSRIETTEEEESANWIKGGKYDWWQTEPERLKLDLLSSFFSSTLPLPFSFFWSLFSHKAIMTASTMTKAKTTKQRKKKKGEREKKGIVVIATSTTNKVRFVLIWNKLAAVAWISSPARINDKIPY